MMEHMQHAKPMQFRSYLRERPLVGVQHQHLFCALHFYVVFSSGRAAHGRPGLSSTDTTIFDQKKLREAKFFLSHMIQSGRSTRLDHEHVEFYLSAFLSA